MAPDRDPPQGSAALSEDASPREAAAAPPTERDASPAGRVTLRSILLGILLIPLNTYWVMTVEGIWHSGHPTTMSIMWNVVFNIFVLVLLNLALKRFAPKWALTQAEFIIVYVMLSMASGLAGHDTLQLGLPAMTHWKWFATDENQWAEIFHEYIPSWLTVGDLRILRPYYEGNSTLYTAARIAAWLTPVLWWTFFILALGGVMLCISVIVRKQWTENEKLSFPLVELPLAITAKGGNSSFFSNRMLWIGFGLGFGLDLVNGLHSLVPSVPYLRVRHDQWDLAQGLVTPPWNALAWTPVPLYPFIVGLGYLLPVDLSFSLWFFFIVQKAQRVVVAMIGAQEAPRLPYFPEQTYGAWVAIFVFAMYTARRHLRAVWEKIATGEGELEDRNEPLTYRQAALGILLGMTFIVGFCLKAGMSLGVILVFFALFTVLAVGIIRVRAELGPPCHEMAGVNVPIIMTDFAGTAALDPHSMVMFPLFYWFTGRGYRTQPWPYQLEAMKMAERTGMNYRGMGLAILIALWWGGLASYWAGIHLHYHQGATTNALVMHAGGQWSEAVDRFTNPRKPDSLAIAFTLGGFLFTCFLTYMRTYFVWWPLHPAGYAISTAYGAEYFWSAILIAWAIKVAVLRYGGYRLYRRLIPLMLGLVLGEYTMGAFWSVLSVLLQQNIYDFAPG